MAGHTPATPTPYGFIQKQRQVRCRFRYRFFNISIPQTHLSQLITRSFIHIISPALTPTPSLLVFCDYISVCMSACVYMFLYLCLSLSLCLFYRRICKHAHGMCSTRESVHLYNDTKPGIESNIPIDFSIPNVQVVQHN